MEETRRVCTTYQVFTFTIINGMFYVDSDAFLAVVSALYAKILIIIGLAFPMTEVISKVATSNSFLVMLYFYSIMIDLY